MLCGYHRLVQLQYEITPADHLEKVKVVRGNSTTRVIRICLSVVGLSLGVLGYRYFGLYWSVGLISFFATFLVLELLLPCRIHRRVYYRNPRLFGMRTVTFDDDGLKSDSDVAHVEMKWTSFEKFKETNNLFLMYQTRDVVGIVPKRAFPSQEAVTQFRQLLASKVRRA
jgi:hypothetical protein